MEKNPEGRVALKQWAVALPPWVKAQTPKALDLPLAVDRGELEAICLAREIHAAALDRDKARWQSKK